MLELIKVRVGIRVIDKLIQELERIPNRHFLFIEFEVIVLFLYHKIIALVSMIQPVKFPDRIAARLVIVSEFIFRFVLSYSIWFRVALKYGVFPLIETTQWIYFFGSK